MKIQIIHCDGLDDLRSLQDRLKWVKAQRVLLVMSEQNPPQLSQLDVNRLRRIAETLKSELGFVTNETSLKYSIRSAGLPVYKTIEDSRQQKWIFNQAQNPMASRKVVKDQILNHKQAVERILPAWMHRLVFSLTILAIIVLIAALLPAAHVDLNLPRENQTTELVLPADLDISRVDLIEGIPLFRVSDVIDAAVQQQTTGSVQVADHPAGGMVVFTNLTEKIINIPSGTIVRAVSPVPMRFIVTQTGSLEAGPGTTISLPVEEMDDHGADGNLPAGSIVAVDGQPGYEATVTNPQPLSSGTMKESSAVSQADLQAVKNMMEDALANQFQERVASIIPAGGVLIIESISIVQVISDVELPAIDMPLSMINYMQQAELSGFYYLKSDLLKWAAMAMDTSLQSGRRALADSLSVDSPVITITQAAAVHLTFHASRQNIPEYDPVRVSILIRGLRPASAIQLISTQLFPGSLPVISHSPGWWGWLPLIPMRIAVDG
jgi:hypothetical protein